MSNLLNNLNNKSFIITLFIFLISIVLNALPSYLINRAVYETGPNCWNYALYLNGFSAGVRNSEPQEFTYVLSSPLCRKLQNHEALLSGDIIAVRDLVEQNFVTGDLVTADLIKQGFVTTSFNENHGYVYLSSIQNKSYVASKNGPYPEAPFQVLSEEDLLKIPSYQTTTECRFPNTNKTCQRITESYRCQSVPSYLAANKLILQSDVSLLWIKLKFFEMSLQNYLMDSSKKKVINLSSWNEFKFLNRKLGEKLELSHLNAEFNSRSEIVFNVTDIMILGLIFLQLDSIAGQIYYTHGSPLMNEFETEAVFLKSKIKQWCSDHNKCATVPYSVPYVLPYIQ